ncbi:PilZ domain-containing protein [Nitrospira moscoviensis]|uniref:PilZ domain-containing protein n=1 Tax=Nitrospira moscoviensis TaxID=42253 RepID=A0A0K2G863_NITMO|nr:PilZ domain-containing protein [Nitrospira moscoviensis]ALA57044.1 hypothetical protein NITMOv2_0608 [Nitrospira moscoviensis]
MTEQRELFRISIHGKGSDRRRGETTVCEIYDLTEKGLQIVTETPPRRAVSPPTRNSRSQSLPRTLARMEPARPYTRAHYRLAVSYPAMFCDQAVIGEGIVTNLSVFGCTIQCREAVPTNRRLLLRLILPDQRESLPIDVAEVRWVKDNQVGLQFHHLERTADLRLHGFVWDRMLERLQTLAHQLTSS